MCQQFAKLLSAMSLGDWGGTGGGGLVHSKGENSMAVSGLGCENPWVSHFSHLSANGPRKQLSYLVGPPCSVQGSVESCLCESRETTTAQ